MYFEGVTNPDVDRASSVVDFKRSTFFYDQSIQLVRSSSQYQDRIRSNDRVSLCSGIHPHVDSALRETYGARAGGEIDTPCKDLESGGHLFKNSQADSLASDLAAIPNHPDVAVHHGTWVD